MVGRIYKEDHYTLLHTKYESSGPCGFAGEDFFYVFPMTPPGRGLYGHQGHGWQDLQRTTIHCYTQTLKALGLVVSEIDGEEDFFYVFLIVSLWELSVAIETRVLSHPGSKPNTTFPSPQ